MKYYDVYTEHGKMAVRAFSSDEALVRYCRFNGLLGEPPTKYYAVEITKQEYDDRYYKIA